MNNSFKQWASDLRNSTNQSLNQMSEVSRNTDNAYQSMRGNFRDEVERRKDNREDRAVELQNIITNEEPSVSDNQLQSDVTGAYCVKYFWDREIILEAAPDGPSVEIDICALRGCKISPQHHFFLFFFLNSSTAIL